MLKFWAPKRAGGTPVVPYSPNDRDLYTVAEGRVNSHPTPAQSPLEGAEIDTDPSLWVTTVPPP